VDADRNIYLSIAELSQRYRATDRCEDAGPLTEFELRVFSQHGEDGVIAEVLARIGIDGAQFVEFGIETGREGNCVFLADVLGWAGLFIEPDPDCYASLAHKYARNQRISTLNAIVTEDNVGHLFTEAGLPEEFDVLSIDVDGQDYWIWAGLESYRPRVVVIEYNASLAPDRQLVQPRGHTERWDGTDYFGASLDALCALAQAKGYRLVHTDLGAINAFFVREDLAQDRFPSADAVPRRHEPNYFLQGYRHPADRHRRPYIDIASPEADLQLP
jgi:hypothetical protein